MSKLDSLKITECPYAFAGFAEKHNALCDLIGGMVGENGVSVVIAERNAIIRGNVANGSGGGISGNVTSVVTDVGYLANAYVANANLGTFPSFGKYVTAAGNVVVDSTGVVITTSSGKICNIAFAKIARDMSIQTINVCNNGNIKTIDVLRSAEY